MNLWWILRNFGFMAGIRYLWDSIKVRIGRFFRREKVKSFKDLSDAEAEQVAWSFGIYKWDDRDHLNRMWHKFEKTLN